MYERLYVEKQSTMPLIPLRGISIFPQMVIHFDVGREKSIKALETAMLEDSKVILCTQKDIAEEEPDFDDYYHIGTVAKVKQMLKLPSGSIRVLVEGINRARVVDILEDEYIEADIEEFLYEDDIDLDKEMEALIRIVIDDFEEYLSFNSKMAPDALNTIGEVKNPDKLSDLIASYITLKTEEYQELLEALNLTERLEKLHLYLQQEIELLSIEDKINKRVKKQMNQIQKEYYLKEQMRAIQKELGDEQDSSSDVDRYTEKVEKLDLPEEVYEKTMEEIKRLSKMHPQSAETGVIRTYLDWIIDLPWNISTDDKIDIKNSREILDEDHYGLKEVKERILEFIAVRELTKNAKGPILCLVGPPGVGKTSIARSVAKSLDKNFVRMSLGGVRDEAEIRGHRKTYVGAMPGRIISSIKKAGSNNPLFLLDEIDKLSGDFRGDPASALLEVLDPEQNDTFTDHFLEVPFNLSDIFFLTTANSLSTIPGPLLDRMEVIDISSYTQEEKFEIAKRYLLPKQLKENGLGEDRLQISDSCIRDIIKYYTREAGVRNLEREIGTICRKVAKRIVEEDVKTVRVTVSNLDKYLGIKKYISQENSRNEIGVATGLAWTSVGGETLSIEVNIMEGKGKIQLTGKLGDVMKESAMAAISYTRANADKLGIEGNFHETKDIHIHVPEGAIPKDGPSAGITMATACISALTGRKVDDSIAMTVEITLRGRVLPVGGIKEKVLAANRIGIEKIILPIDNKKDLEELPSYVKNKIEFTFVEDVSEVIEKALLKKDEL